jgi:hypothetical protein
VIYKLLNLEINFGQGLQATVYELTRNYLKNPLQFCWQDFGKQQPLELQVDFQEQYFSLCGN